MELAAPNIIMEYQSRAGPGIRPIMIYYTSREKSIWKLDFLIIIYKQIRETIALCQLLLYIINSYALVSLQRYVYTAS